MKLRNLFYLLLALPLVFAACETLGDQTSATKEAKLTVTTTSEEFELDGGPGLIYYTLTDAPAGAKVNATCEADWVSDITVATEYISYNVALNTGDARETKIVVSYEAQVFEVAVSQAGKAVVVLPKFELVSEDTLELSCKAALGYIEFSIENPVEGQTVTAKANQDWISEFNAAENYVEFVVAANYGEAREATITLSYGVLEPLTVTVKQAAAVPELVIYSADTEFLSDTATGEISFGVENVLEPGEVTVACEAEWLTIDSVENGVVSFTVAANENEEAREAVVTLTSGELTASVTVMQYQAGYDPNHNYLTFETTECWANSENGGLQWNLTFVEHDSVKGDMQTLISFALAEANSQRITDGTYSVENGGILVNSASLNGFSIYRGNTSEAADIFDATFEVNTNTERQSITIYGSFQAGNNIVTLNYRGTMRGMDLGEAIAGAIEHTEWATVTKNWHDNKELLFTATSADGSLKAVFDFYDYDSSTALAAGEYEVSAYYSGIGAHLRASSYFTYNGVESQLASGSATVEHIAGGYKITYNVVDQLGREFTGVIEGPIEDANNPA